MAGRDVYAETVAAQGSDPLEEGGGSDVRTAHAGILGWSLSDTDRFPRDTLVGHDLREAKAKAAQDRSDHNREAGDG